MTPPQLRGTPDQFPLPYGTAAEAGLRCIGSTARLLADRRVHLPTGNVGRRFTFADGTSARVYRETVIDDGPVRDPCVLIVTFTLRVLRGRGHDLFRMESILNTPLFVGFPGFVSKLWLEADEDGAYRGIYQWDGAASAEHYARSLWRVLAIGSVPGSIHYQLLPGMRRETFTDEPSRTDATAPGAATAWWRVVGEA
jgi:hypothetical protein